MPREKLNRPVGPDTPAVRVSLVDDQELVRRGVGGALADCAAITAVGEAGTVAQALARVPAVRPAVILVDMRLPDGDRAKACRRLRPLIRLHVDAACLSHPPTQGTP